MTPRTRRPRRAGSPRGAGRYVHGTSPREQERLGMMNDLLNEGALRMLAMRPGERALDLGCGTGILTRALARAAGPDRVVGVERSPGQLRAARRLARAAGEEGLAEFRAGDALAPPLAPGEWGSFDVVHTRFLLEHLAAPRDLVRLMVRAARPGGRIVLQDEDHEILRTWPEPEGFARAWRAYIRTYRVRGNDPSVGRRLASLLCEAGARPARCEWIFFGGCAGEPRFRLVVENLARILEGAAGDIAATGLVTRGGLRRTVAAFRAWGARPGAALWFAVACAVGVRPAP